MCKAERAPLDAGKDDLIDGLGVLSLAHNDAASRAAQGLVRRGGDEVGIRDGVGVQPGGNQPGKAEHAKARRFC